MLKFVLPFQFFVSSIRGLGTDRHYQYVEKADSQEVSINYSLSFNYKLLLHFKII